MGRGREYLLAAPKAESATLVPQCRSAAVPTGHRRLLLGERQSGLVEPITTFRGHANDPMDSRNAGDSGHLGHVLPGSHPGTTETPLKPPAELLPLEQ
jgi:hypothetical protein